LSTSLHSSHALVIWAQSCHACWHVAGLPSFLNSQQVHTIGT
jgi:hypothetical protein